MSESFSIVKQFESAVSQYTGAPFVVTTNSCTMALLMAVKWHAWLKAQEQVVVEIPKRTYVSVPQSIIHAGCRVTFRDEGWTGGYQLQPLPVWDFARRFTSGMYQRGTMQCVSFHTSKILGDTQGGAILHDDPRANRWLRKARFDGRTEGIAPKDDTIDMVGYHCYMSPDVAARLLWKLSHLPMQNPDLPNSDYPDLSAIKAFQ